MAAIDEIRVVARDPGARNIAFDIMRLGRGRQLARPPVEPGIGRGRARRPPTPRPAAPPQTPIEEITVTARRIVPRVLRLGGAVTFVADIGARIIDELSRQRLDEIGADITRPVQAPPDTPVQTIPPEVIPEIIVTGTRPIPRPVPAPPTRRTIPRRTRPPVRRPFRPPRRRVVPAPPVVPAPTVPEPRPRRRTTPVPPLRWPMNPNLPVPATPGLPRVAPLPLIPRPEIFPNVPTRPLPTQPTRPAPAPSTPTLPTPLPGPGVLPLRPSPTPAPAPQPAPGGVPELAPVPVGFPVPVPGLDPAALTDAAQQVVGFGQTAAVPFAVPGLQLAAAQCPPCKKDEKREKRRDECWKKMVEERAFERWDQEYKWQEIDCLTGRPL